VTELRDYGIEVDVHDPWVDAEAARGAHGIEPAAEPSAGAYDGIILAVAHDRFREIGAAGIRAFGRDPHVLYDLKYVLAPGKSDVRL